ncbi:MAG: indole-3-glycerol phosphate synthase TrpC [Deltaproteobacteria bacterium]|nr:indole-3-glycerol phosphate synthase TrpC [Deltaproteobacteria bacterium]
MILDDIVRDKREELEHIKKYTRISDFEKTIQNTKAIRSFANAITVKPAPHSIRIIAEVKKASPSKGVLRAEFVPYDIARCYESGGAAAISVLTESKYFKGKLDYLTPIKNNLKLPVLRKDFIFDDFQIYESRAAGADALLLIASILDTQRLKELIDLTARLGMDSLVEVHNEAEIKKAVDAGARIIGINNRNLQTFETDIETTFKLAPLVPEGCLIVSESGINSYEDILNLKDAGVSAFLIGEALVKEHEIARKLRALRGIAPRP